MPASTPGRNAEIYRLHAEALTLAEIGDRVGLGPSRVCQILKAHAGATGGLTPTQKQRIRNAELAELGRAGASTRELAERFCLSRSWVNKILRANGVKRRGFLADPDLCPTRTVEICQLHHDGVSAKELAKRFGLTQRTIYNRIRNAKLRSLGMRPKARAPSLNPIRSSIRASLRTT
jgi:DNA-binding CsgD family transcriptional regulator